jgi:hypothetical protein
MNAVKSVAQNTMQEWTTEETAGRKMFYRIANCHISKTFRCALTGSGSNGRPKARWNGQIPVGIEDRQTYKGLNGDTSRKEAI